VFLSDECLFFEIYDTYGDGIYAPGGCELYLDEMLVYSGANDIGSYAMTVVNCWDSCGMILNALNDLQAHINGTITLDAEELTLIRNVFTLFPECLAGSESIILLAKSVVEDYDNDHRGTFYDSHHRKRLFQGYCSRTRHGTGTGHVCASAGNIRSCIHPGSLRRLSTTHQWLEV
jgi:hypothetical protein